MISTNPLNLHVKKYKESILSEISKVLNSGNYLAGEQNEKLVKNLQKKFNSKYILTVKSGHDSLSLALSALNLTAADEIIFPVNAYPTAFPVALSKAKPIPVDVDENGQLDPRNLSKKITKNTKAIIVVHLYGLVGKLDEIMEIAKKNNITLIEDCAQAFGTKYRDGYVGTFGDIGCFSFYPTKNLGALGDGGAIILKHKYHYDYILKAKSYGSIEKYNAEFISGHSRLPEIQAAILNVFLENYESTSSKKNSIANLYKNTLEKAGLRDHVTTFISAPESDPHLHLFVLRVNNRDHLKKYLEKKGIETQIHYPKVVHLVKAFQHLGYKEGDFPTAETLTKSIISLPFHPYLTKAQINTIVRAIKKFYYENGARMIIYSPYIFQCQRMIRRTAVMIAHTISPYLH
jgi:dTDP-4-amino-4,6-dideoxygalactose transaminase